MPQKYWIAKGKVTDPSCYPNAEVKLGDDEWQFSARHPDERLMSYDYLSLEAGIRDLGPAIFEFAE